MGLLLNKEMIQPTVVRELKTFKRLNSTSIQLLQLQLFEILEFSDYLKQKIKHEKFFGYGNFAYVNKNRLLWPCLKIKRIDDEIISIFIRFNFGAKL